jgi:pectate lyase
MRIQNQLSLVLVVILPFAALPGASVAGNPSQPSAWNADQAYAAGSAVRCHDRNWIAQADVPAGHGPLGAGDGTPADRALLLDRRAGFGQHVTGGNAGPTFHVTTAADSGPGSLREALAQPGPLWIVFDGDYTIALRSGLPVTSDKTIDGRGHRVLITGHTLPGLRIWGQSNIIVEAIYLRDFGDIALTKSNDPNSAIQIQDRAHDIWIDHCSLSMAGDKLIAIHGGATAITVSWNKCFEQEQVFQMGCQATHEQDVDSCLTSHHNFFDSTGYRHPVASSGKVHAYNNYLRHWKQYGMRGQRNAQFYSEANIFEAGENTAGLRFDAVGNGWNDPHTLFDKSPGFVRSVNDWKVNNVKLRTREPEKVFSPSQCYSYKADKADASLKELVAGYAGPQPEQWRPATP